jgi:hypothetical protein
MEMEMKNRLANGNNGVQPIRNMGGNLNGNGRTMNEPSSVNLKNNMRNPY